MVKYLILVGLLEVGIELENGDLGVKTSDMPFLAYCSRSENVNYPHLRHKIYHNSTVLRHVFIMSSKNTLHLAIIQTAIL